MNIEYLKIAKSAASKYAKNMSEFDYLECIYGGLSDALSTFNSDSGNRISTHIYNRVRYLCLNTIKKNKKFLHLEDDFFKDDIVYECRFDPKFTEILIDRYVYHLSLEEISKKYIISIKEAKSTIRRRKNILKKFYQK